MPYPQAIIAPNVLARVFRTRNRLKKTMYRETSGCGAQAVMGHETNVQMKNAQKHCKYQGFLLGHLRPTYCQCYHHSFSFKPEAHDKKSIYQKTSSYGAQAVIGHEINVETINAQKHCK